MIRQINGRGNIRVSDSSLCLGRESSVMAAAITIARDTNASCSNDDTNTCTNNQANNTQKRVGIVDQNTRGSSEMTAVRRVRAKSDDSMRRDGTMMAPLRSVQGSQGGSCKGGLKIDTMDSRVPKTTTCTCIPNNRAKECPHNSPQTPLRRRKRSTTYMTIEETHKITSLLEFVQKNDAERVNLLQIAMSTFEVCHHPHKTLCVPCVLAVDVFWYILN